MRAVNLQNHQGKIASPMEQISIIFRKDTSYISSPYIVINKYLL